MTEFTNTLTSSLTREQKNALVWKIEGDYQQSGTSMFEPKHYYIRMAIKYYTRNDMSLKDIVSRYRDYRRTAKKPMFRIFAERQEFAQAS